MLSAVDGMAVALRDGLPKCNAEAPDRLHFKAGGLGGTNPDVVVELAAIFVQTTTKRSGELIS